MAFGTLLPLVLLLQTAGTAPQTPPLENQAFLRAPLFHMSLPKLPPDHLSIPPPTPTSEAMGLSLRSSTPARLAQWLMLANGVTGAIIGMGLTRSLNQATKLQVTICLVRVGLTDVLEVHPSSKTTKSVAVTLTVTISPLESSSTTRAGLGMQSSPPEPTGCGEIGFFEIDVSVPYRSRLFSVV